MGTSEMARTQRGAMQGFTLIEVMISVLIFSVGLLGTAALQARAVQMATQNEDRSRAAILANEMVAQLWANQSATPADLAGWKAKVANAAVSGLPNGVGAVATTASTSTAVITITWKAPSAPKGAPANSYTTTVVIQ